MPEKRMQRNTAINEIIEMGNLFHALLFNFYNDFRRHNSKPHFEFGYTPTRNKAFELLGMFPDYSDAIRDSSYVNEGLASLNSDGIIELYRMFRTLADRYKLPVRNLSADAHDRIIIESTVIDRFIAQVKNIALARLEVNEQELPKLRSNLLTDADNYEKGDGSILDMLFEGRKNYEDDKKSLLRSYFLLSPNVNGYTPPPSFIMSETEKLGETQSRIRETEANNPLAAMIKDKSNAGKEEIKKEIERVVGVIAKSQQNIRTRILIEHNFPLWQMTPVVEQALIGFSAIEKREINEWIAGQKKTETIRGVFEFAIPIGVAVACFFIPGGASFSLLLLRAGLQTTAALVDVISAKNSFDSAQLQSNLAKSGALTPEAGLTDATISDTDTYLIMAWVSLVFSLGSTVDAARAFRIFSKYNALPPAIQTQMSSLGRKGADIIANLSVDDIAKLRLTSLNIFDIDEINRAADLGSAQRVIQNRLNGKFTQVQITDLPDQSAVNRLGYDNATGGFNQGEGELMALLEKHTGRVERFPEGLTEKQADFIITDGPYKGTTIDFMFTTSSQEETHFMNHFFVKNLTKDTHNTMDTIFEHLGKADIVPFDFRNLTPANQQVLLNVIGSNILTTAQKSQIIIVR